MPSKPQRPQGLTPDIRSNIERYLNDHAREDGHAWQMNMAAKRPEWTPIGDPELHSDQRSSDGDGPSQATGS